MKMNILCAALIASSAAFAGLATTTTSAIAGQWKNCNHEGGFCNPSGYTTKIRYGVNGRWKVKNTTGGVWCTNQNFGDPAPGRRKNCDAYYPNWETCTHEGGFCKVGAGTSVRYGTSPHKSGRYYQKKAGNGGIWCDNHNFGDPVMGKRKNCWVLK